MSEFPVAFDEKLVGSYPAETKSARITSTMRCLSIEHGVAFGSVRQMNLAISRCFTDRRYSHCHSGGVRTEQFE